MERFMICDVDTNKVLAVIMVKVESWMDDVDVASAANEQVAQWCSDNGYSEADDVYTERV